MNDKIHIEDEAEVESPVRLIVDHYDAALKAIYRAHVAHERGDRITRGKAVSQALAILQELTQSLDPLPAPRLVRRLIELYLWTGQLLVEANVFDDGGNLAKAARILSTLRSGWSDLHDRMRSETRQ